LKSSISAVQKRKLSTSSFEFYKAITELKVIHDILAKDPEQNTSVKEPILAVIELERAGIADLLTLSTDLTLAQVGEINRNWQEREALQSPANPTVVTEKDAQAAKAERSKAAQADAVVQHLHAHFEGLWKILEKKKVTPEAIAAENSRTYTSIYCLADRF
jgi:hypothetical protein